MMRKEGEDRGSLLVAYPAARSSISSICLASAKLKKCLHFSLSFYSLSPHIGEVGGKRLGSAEWRGCRGKKERKKERKDESQKRMEIKQKQTDTFFCRSTK